MAVAVHTRTSAYDAGCPVPFWATVGATTCLTTDPPWPSARIDSTVSRALNSTTRTNLMDDDILDPLDELFAAEFGIGQLQPLATFGA